MTIFISAAVDELERRLRERATESTGEIGERIALAREQLEQADRVRLRRRERRSRAGGRASSRSWSAVCSFLQVPCRGNDLIPASTICSKTLTRAMRSSSSSAKRARQINNYHHQLGEGTFDDNPPPLVESRSKNYLTMAMEEISEGMLTYDYVN